MEWAITEILSTGLAAGGIWAIAGVGIIVLPWTDPEVRGVTGAIGGLASAAWAWALRSDDDVGSSLELCTDLPVNRA